MDKSIGSICMDKFKLSAFEDKLEIFECGSVGVIMHILYDDNSADVITDGVGTNRFELK